MSSEAEIKEFVERTAGEIIASLKGVETKLAVQILQNSLFYAIRTHFGGSFPASVTAVTEWVMALAMKEKNGEYVGGTKQTLQ